MLVFFLVLPTLGTDIDYVPTLKEVQEMEFDTAYNIWPNYFNDDGWYEFRCGKNRTKLPLVGVTIGVFPDNEFCAEANKKLNEKETEFNQKKDVFSAEEEEKCKNYFLTRLDLVRTQVQAQLGIKLKVTEFELLSNLNVKLPEKLKDLSANKADKDRETWDDYWKELRDWRTTTLETRKDKKKHGINIFPMAHNKHNQTPSGAADYIYAGTGSVIVFRELWEGPYMYATFQHELGHTFGAHHFYNQDPNKKNATRRGDGIMGQKTTTNSFVGKDFNMQPLLGIKGMDYAKVRAQLHPYHELENPNGRPRQSMCKENRRMREEAIVSSESWKDGRYFEHTTEPNPPRWSDWHRPYTKNEALWFYGGKLPNLDNTADEVLKRLSKEGQGKKRENDLTGWEMEYSTSRDFHGPEEAKCLPQKDGKFVKFEDPSCVCECQKGEKKGTLRSSG